VPLAKPLRTWSGPAAGYLACGAVGLAPLWLGGVSVTAHVALFALSLLALLLHLIDRGRERRPVAISWTVAVFVLAFVATAMTLAPLPDVIRATLDPRSTDLKHFIADGLSADAGAQMLPVLAVDPPEAALALLRILGALCVFVVLGDQTRRSGPRARAYRALIVCGAVVLLVAAFHRVAQLDQIYGLAKVPNKGPLWGPLVNGNHLARVLGAFSFFGIAYLFSAKSRTEQLVVGLCAAALALAVALTYSIGGILAYAATMAGVGTVWLFQRGAENRPRGNGALPLAAFAAAGCRAVVRPRGPDRRARRRRRP
jgi:hypothetical protein